MGNLGRTSTLVYSGRSPDGSIPRHPSANWLGNLVYSAGESHDYTTPSLQNGLGDLASRVSLDHSYFHSVPASTLAAADRPAGDGRDGDRGTYHHLSNHAPDDSCVC